jgi:uncharacterized protein
MSDAPSSTVVMFDNSDHEMRRAYEQARSTFRYFWRELAWERRRIVPALDLACIKAPFSDGPSQHRTEVSPKEEQMWLNEIDFDGQFISGILLNEPNWLKSVKVGDSARFTPDQITDWMYVIDREVYGAFTVNLIRSRMSAKGREEYDRAWGLSFGDPATVRLVRVGGGWFENLDAADGEHPMSLAMVPSLQKGIAGDPSLIHSADERGWTLLHQQALAGSAATVEVLLDAGADVNAVTENRMTPLQLACSLGWVNVASLLTSRGEKVMIDGLHPQG